MGIQRNCKFMAGWDMKYTRPPRKENQKIRIGGAHGSVAKGGFKGLKTWNISCQVSRIKGVENKGRSGGFCEYMEREEECVVAYGDESKIAKQKYAELEEKLFKQKKNSVIQRRFVIPLPKEILNNPEGVEKLLKTLQSRYFSSCYSFSAALHKSENFKNPHVHIQYSNVDANFKAIREFQDPNILSEIKKDIKHFIESDLKISCQMKGIGESIKHYPKWVAAALKRAEEAEKRGDGGKMMREYEERYPLFAQYLSERERKMYERAIQLKENRLKKTAEVEKMCVVNLNENIKNKINGTWSWLYSKSQKEGLKQDLENNNEVLSDLDKKTSGGFGISENPAEVEKEKIERKIKQIHAEIVALEKINKVLGKKVAGKDFSKSKKVWEIRDTITKNYGKTVTLNNNISSLEDKLKELKEKELTKKAAQENTELQEKQEQTKKQELEEQTQPELKDFNKFGRDKDREKARDAFAEDLENRLNKGKGFGI